MDNCVYVTNKSSVMPRGKHMLQTAPDMEMTTMCAYPSS